MKITPLQPADMAEFTSYLTEHLAANGDPAVGYFMPLPRGASFFSTERGKKFGEALSFPCFHSGWRRCWVMRTETGHIVGHVDLRGHTEPHTEHRCLLGLGVAGNYRRRGIARQLCEHVIGWAREAKLAAIDLQVLDGNRSAVALYESLGFATVMQLEDFFRVDGHSIGEIRMVLTLPAHSRAILPGSLT
jgi:ribosomal protein S18 acetylase RimI-like enzyme